MESTFRNMFYLGMLIVAGSKAWVWTHCARMLSQQMTLLGFKSARDSGTRVTQCGTDTGAQKGGAICMYTEPNRIRNKS